METLGSGLTVKHFAGILHSVREYKATVTVLNIGSTIFCELCSLLSCRCSTVAHHWLSSLGHSDEGSCDLLGALKVALRLKEVDTICVVLSSR